MRFLFPQNPLVAAAADSPFDEEYMQFKRRGIECSLFDYDSLKLDEFKPRPRLKRNETVLYRGWMLNDGDYKKLANFVASLGGVMYTSQTSDEVR